jgi:uncharacterized protein with von Willebrand factor type A (vWA) domain
MAQAPASPPLVTRLFALVDVLRRSGVDVATGDVVDATRAMEILDLGDRAAVRAALCSVLIKHETDLATYDRFFDVVFTAVYSDARVEPDFGARAAPTAAPGADRPVLLAGDVATAAACGDLGAMHDLAARAAALFDDVDGSATGRQAMYRVMRALDLTNMLSTVLRRLRTEGDLSPLELSLRRHEVARALEEFRRALAAEIAKLRDREMIAGGEVPPIGVGGADRPLVSLTPSELRELRRTLQPLARQLAARVGRRRRPRATGRVDLRRTLRRSLQSGGIPIDPVLRRRHPHRPEVVVLCDISGSVAEFAQFTFSLVHAIHDVLAGVRSFAFVGGVTETTDLFAEAIFDVHVQRLLERPGVVGLDGHSDYGAVFRQFADQHLELVGRRTTLIVTGDGRSNFREPDVEAFGSIAERARRVYWLDPEPPADWFVDDSAIGDYAPLCNGVFQVSSVRSLADVIAELV